MPRFYLTIAVLFLALVPAVLRSQQQETNKTTTSETNEKTTEVPLRDGSKLVVKNIHGKDAESVMTYIVPDPDRIDSFKSGTTVSCGCAAKVNGKWVWYWVHKECRNSNGNVCHCENPSHPSVQCS